MTVLLAVADDVLRGRPWTTGAARPWWVGARLAALIVAGGLIYGGVMGSSAGVADGRIWQVIDSAIKVPLLLLATGAIGLPSFFVLHTLLGLRADFALALRALAASQAALTIVLASLAPITALWNLSTASYRATILFNALMFAVASLGAQVVLRRAYRPLIARDRRHRALLRIWIVLYAFVGIQMGWVLRPFIGDPSRPVELFRAQAWDNAYVIVARMIWEVLAR